MTSRGLRMAALLAAAWLCSPAWGQDAAARAQEALSAGRAAEARDLADAEIRIAPENAEAHRIRALALEALREWPAAEQAWVLYAQITRSGINRTAAAQHVAYCRAMISGGVAATHLEPEQDPELARTEAAFTSVKSAHFTVKARNPKLARLVSERAEETLNSLCRTFLGDRAWAHEIPITVYKDHAEYVAAGNPPWSGGGTAFAFEGTGALDWRVKRSIDLFQLDARGRMDRELLPNTLPHELTHLVLSEHFGENPIPLWLTEGLAQQMESVPAEYFDKVVTGALNSGGKGYVPLALVLSIDRYPESPAEKYLFYRESASFTRFLLQNMPRERFFKLLDDCKRGFLAIAGLSEIFAAPPDRVAELLEKKWHAGLQALHGASVKSVEDAERSR